MSEAGATLAAGTRLGPYEVVEPLGAGGMGEVYRARDARLGRDVAVKVLPRSAALDPVRLARFEREARAAGSLHHPNLVAVLDVGVEGGAPYVVLELLSGATLRERLLDGPLPPRQAARLGAEIARGLAAAHAGGILHRDLKPDNVFVTRDGRVKVLDFGLAKLVRDDEGDARAEGPTETHRTAEGSVVGTVGYMSPEQLRGDALDHRSDLFALGILLHELVRGRRPFEGRTPADTAAAILKEDPPPLSGDGAALPPAFEAIVRRCLEKEPERRFQQAADLAFALEALAEPGPGTASAGAKGPARASRRAVAALVLAAAAAGAGAALLVPVRGGGNPASFERLTFRNGRVSAARFVPGGREVVYTAAWDGATAALFSTVPGSPESRALGPTSARLAAISSRGELALLLRAAGGLAETGTLARMALAGEAPREVAENVQDAAWDRSGETLAVVRYEGAVQRLEYPIGTPLVSAPPPRWLSSPSVAPDGRLVAFVEHAAERFDEAGSVAVVDRAGSVRRLTGPWWSISGAVFSARGDEVLFSGSEGRDGAGGVYAVRLDGRLRTLLRSPDPLALLDRDATGRLLLARQLARVGVVARLEADGAESDLSWYDGTWVRDLSPDGRTLLFDEEADAGGPRAGVFVRKGRDAVPVRLGDGNAVALSPDGAWALARQRFTAPPRLVLLPTGPGAPREVSIPDVELFEAGSFFPDGERLLLVGASDGKPRCFEWVLATGAARPLSEPGTVCRGVTPDGAALLARRGVEPWALVPVRGGPARPIPALRKGDRPLRFGADGSWLFVMRGAPPGDVERVHLATGRRETALRLPPLPPAGLSLTTPPVVSADGRAYAYTYLRELSDLFLVTPAPGAR